MRKSTALKNYVTTLVSASLVASLLGATAVAADSNARAKRSKIDNEILALATDADQKSQARVRKQQAAKRAALKAKQNKTVKSQPAPTRIALPIESNVSQDSFQLQSNPVAVESRTTLKEVTPEETRSFSGSVDITIGSDSNATAEKAPIPEAPVIKGTFFQVAPTLNFKGQLFSGGVGANIKDWSDQKLSDTAKETQITANLAANYEIGLTKMMTKIDFENTDSQWPDYLNGTTNGMPLRYFQARITQGFNWDLGKLKLGMEGSFANKDYTTPYSDNPADHIFGQTIFEQDQRVAQGSFRVGAKLGESVELAVRPLIRHTRYTKEPARQTNGQKGGAAFDPITPRREVLKQEGNLDLIISTGRIDITPTLTFGNDSDEALGALDNTYRGAGIKAALTIDPETKLKLTAGFNYKEADFDNWTYNGLNVPIANNEKRRDTAKTTSVGASVNLNKNVGIAINYSRVEERSNWETPDLNYEQEIIGSTLNLTF